MTVIFRCKTKVTAALCRIFCLLHRTQGQTADHCLIRQSLDTLDDLLDLLRGDLLTGLLHRDPLVSKKRQKTLHTFRIRGLVSTVYKRILTLTVLLCNGLICHQHEILNDLCRHIRLISLHIDRSSRAVEGDLALRKIKVDRSSVVPAAPKKL